MLSAVAPREAALLAWNSWKANYLTKAHEQLETRFTPEIYRRFTHWGLEDDTLSLLAQARRTTWLRTTALMQETKPLLKKMAESGVQLILLKGSALAFGYFEDPGYRYFRDVDLYVPRSEAKRTIALFREAGWEICEPYKEPLLEYHHGISIGSPDGGIVDLHWSITYFERCERFNKELCGQLWQRSYQDLPFEVLACDAQLFHVLVHGGMMPRGTHWMLDAKRLLEMYGESIDWDRILYFARGARANRVLEQTVKRIAAVNPDLFDAGLLAYLCTGRRSKLERFENFVRRTRPQRFFGGLFHRMVGYQRSGFVCNRKNHLSGFLRYLASHWESRSRMDFLKTLSQKLLAHLRALLQGIKQLRDREAS